MVARILALATLSLLPLSSLAARDIFVDNLGGDDRNNGQSHLSEGRFNGPCKSITKALLVVHPGDRIVLTAHPEEPYREMIAVQGGFASGYKENPVEILGNGAVLDGTISLTDAEWEFEGKDTFSVRPRLMAFQQLFIAGKAAQRVAVRDGAFPSLAPLQWCLYEGKIYFRAQPGRIPASYDPACCGAQTGITLYEVHDVVIRDLTLRGYQLDGLNAHDTARGIDVINVRSIDNGRSGFSIGGASRVRLDGCSAGGNGVAQLRTEGYSHTEISACMFDEATAPAMLSDGGTITKK